MKLGNLRIAGSPRRCWVTIFFLVLLTATATFQGARAQTFSLSPVVLQGQPAPGTGGSFSSFISSSLNDSGTVVFRALISGGSTRQGIFLFSGGAISPIVLEGQVAPGTGGLKFSNFIDTISINNASDVAFIGRLEDGRAGIFFFSRGEISSIAQTFQTVPGTNLTLLNFGGVSLNDSGAIAFSSGDDAGRIYLFSNGRISLIASPEGTQFNSFDAPSLNNKGEIAFVNGIRSGFAGIVSVGISLYSQGKLTTIFSSGPSLITARLNDAGLVAFLRCVSGDCGIQLYKDGSVSPIALKGQIASGDSTFSSFSSWISLNKSGFIAFAAGFNSSISAGDAILLYDGNSFVKVAAKSDGAPGTGGEKFSDFSLPPTTGNSSPTLNNQRAVAFIASVTGGTTSSGIFLATPIGVQQRLYFAQFGDGSQGSTSIFSQITLVSLDSTAPANVVLEISDDFGNAMTFDLNGAIVAGRKDLVIPADGAVTLKTDGQGPIQSGSVTVTSDRSISGVILFGGSVGTAGVGGSKPLRKFVAPMETGLGINTGVALMGLGQNQTILLELRDQQGNLMARGAIPLGARSHLAKFLTELQWDTPPDFSIFSGTLTATGTEDFAAIVIRVSPGQFATMPVAEKN